MKYSTLAIATAFALSSTLACAQNTSGDAAGSPTATAPPAGASTARQPATNAGESKLATDGAQPAGNEDNSGGARPAPSSRTSPGQKNEETGG
jgi:hypothetical protein